MKDFSMELMKRATKKLTEKFIGPYVVKKIVSENVVELELLTLLRIHPVVNVRRIMKYREQVEEQKKIPPSPIEIASEKKYVVSRSLTIDFIFIFSFHFILFLFFIFILFSIFRTTRVRVYQSRCHISHKLMAKSQD